MEIGFQSQTEDAFEGVRTNYLLSTKDIGTETKPLGFYLTVIMTTLTLPFYCVFNYTFCITDF